MGDFFPRFQQIFRQAEESAVIRGAHDAEKAMDLILILHAEHALNASTFAALRALRPMSSISPAISVCCTALIRTSP